MSSRTLIRLPDAPAGRLDRTLAAAWQDFSRSRLQTLIRGGSVTVGGQTVTDPAATVPPGAEIRLDEPAPVAAGPAPENIPVAIAYEDDELVVVDKPAGLVVHPGAGHSCGTLVNALLHHCAGSLSGIGGIERPGIVHRLDKDTSGLLVVAKTDRAHRGLAEQFADHGRTGPLERAYLAFVWGVPEPPRGTVDAAIARSTANRDRMAITRGERGRKAITHYAVQETFAVPAGDIVASLLRCTLETGRTHQIRLHLAHIRHPVIGDPVYGAGFRTKAALLPDTGRAAVEALGRQALHATLLAFEHPVTGEVLSFESCLPDDLERLAQALRALA